MKKLYKFLLLTLIGITLLLSIYISFKNFKSLIQQNYLITDFNSGSPKLDYEFVKDFEDEIPNVIATTLPIKSMKAYYLNKEGLSDSAINLIKQDKSNPFIYYSEALLGDIYLKKDQLDSAKIYLSKAFYGLPNNTNHRLLYFNLLSKLKDSVELKKSIKYLNTINKKLNLATWKNYLSSMSSIVGPGNKDLIKKLDSLKLKFPDDNDIQHEIPNLVLFGIENVAESLSLSNQADEYFKFEKFKEAILLYEKAIEKLPTKFEYYESLGVCNLKIKENILAEENFKKAIKLRPKKKSDGKAEFYLGALMLNRNIKDSACIYFRRSFKYDYKESIGFINTYCK